MIRFAHGNLLTADAEALVNTVNCVGVMGKGIALQFKQAFPDNFRSYAAACKRGEVRPGQMFVFTTGAASNPRFIINFPTKRHFRDPSRIEDIECGLTALVRELHVHGIRSIAIPPLGCGNGGLVWNDVRPRIEHALQGAPNIEVLLYAPAGAPQPSTMPVRTSPPRMTRGRALLVKLLEAYLRHDYGATRIEMQKLAYFLQTAGEPLKLNFVKHTFGPFASNLNHVLHSMEGHLIRGFGDGSARAEISLVPGALDEAERLLAEEPDARERLERVRQLIEGFESPYGMELLGTVHWVAIHEVSNSHDAKAIVEAVRGWNERKRERMKPAHIAKAHERLAASGWIAPGAVHA
jgi:O-acetyl-ADP-ribose deacetylase (regulator of RNase III)